MRKQIEYKITAAVFLAFIGIAGAASLMSGEKAFSETENRYLQKKPEFSWKGLWDGSYGEEYESYLSDQFPARDSWIGVKVLAERLQFKEDVNGVYFGRDGYLMEKYEREDIMTGQMETNLSKLSAMVQSGEQRLGENHVKVMLLPSASTVMTGKLPFLAAPFDQRLLEQELEQLVGAGQVITMDRIFGGHEEEAVYYRTDHHWTALGAYYGYRAFAESVGLEPWGQQEFRVETVTDGFLGTIQSKVNVPVKPDTIELYLPEKEMRYQVYYDGSQVPEESLYSYHALEGKDKYSVYLDGNHALTEIVNEWVSKERRGTSLLIVKDSFAHSFAPFVVNHYEHVYMLDLRYYNLTVSGFLDTYPVTDLLFLYQIPGFSKETSINKLR